MTPAGWRRVRLSEVAGQRTEKVVPAETDKRPYVALEHLGPGSAALLGWASASSAISAKTIFRAGDVLFGKLRPYLRKAARAPFDGLCSTDILPLFSENPLDTRYLAQLAQWPSLQRHAVATSSGTKMPRTSWPQLGTFEFPLPPLAEQHKIAAILSSVDDAIEKTQALIGQMQVVKRGLMQELLTRGLPGRHTRFRQTEAGEIPDEWEVCELTRLCDRMFVGIAQAATHAYTDRGVPIVRTTNVRANCLDVENMLYITEEFAKEMKKRALCGGDVLTARTGYPGTSVAVPGSLEGAQCFTLLVSRPGPRLRSQYLCHTMNSDLGTKIVSRGQAGGAQQNLNVAVFGKALLALPSIEEQDQICGVLDACYSAEDREESSRRVLGALKSALMSVLLTGEVRVTLDSETIRS